MPSEPTMDSVDETAVNTFKFAASESDITPCRVARTPCNNGAKLRHEKAAITLTLILILTLTLPLVPSSLSLPLVPFLVLLFDTKTKTKTFFRKTWHFPLCPCPFQPASPSIVVRVGVRVGVRGKGKGQGTRDKGQWTRHKAQGTRGKEKCKQELMAKRQARAKGQETRDKRDKQGTEQGQGTRDRDKGCKEKDKQGPRRQGVRRGTSKNVHSLFEDCAEGRLIRRTVREFNTTHHHNTHTPHCTYLLELLELSGLIESFIF
jgi:hypothetical protein